MTFEEWWDAAKKQNMKPPFITEDMRFHFEACWDSAQDAGRAKLKLTRVAVIGSQSVILMLCRYHEAGLVRNSLIGLALIVICAQVVALMQNS